MHRYNFDIPATLRLRELIADYGRMRGLEEMTVQQRGQRLNEFVAELLRYWGLGRVEANVRSIGEIVARANAVCAGCPCRFRLGSTLRWDGRIGPVGIPQNPHKSASRRRLPTENSEVAERTGAAVTAMRTLA